MFLIFQMHINVVYRYSKESGQAYVSNLINYTKNETESM